MSSPSPRKSRRERPYRGPDRRVRGFDQDVEPVVLTRKYADVIDGVDLEGHDVGDRLPLRSRDARLLIAEGWAAPAAPEQRRRPDAIRKPVR